MLDGKPGQVIQLVAESALESGIVKREISREVGDHYDIGSMERAARVWATKGLAAIPVVHNEFIGVPYKNKKGTQIETAIIHYTLTLVAPDGSFISATGIGAASSHGGRHISQARTDARKECIRGLLCMASEESDQVAADKRQAEHEAVIAAQGEWTDDLRSVVAAIDACANEEELTLVGKHDSQSKLTIEEREIARAEWKRRRDDLRNLGTLSYSNRAGSKR